jgi:hypothetical protein
MSTSPFFTSESPEPNDKAFSYKPPPEMDFETLVEDTKPHRNQQTLTTHQVICQHEPSRVLICLVCRRGIISDLQSVSRHFRVMHEYETVFVRKITAFVKSLPLSNDPRVAEMPPNNSPPIPMLRVLPGFSCDNCPYLSASRNRIESHLYNCPNRSQVMQGRISGPRKNRWREVTVQSFCQHLNKRYWTVNASATARELAVNQAVVSQAPEAPMHPPVDPNMSMSGTGSDVDDSQVDASMNDVHGRMQLRPMEYPGMIASGPESTRTQRTIRFSGRFKNETERQHFMAWLSEFVKGAEAIEITIT